MDGPVERALSVGTQTRGHVSHLEMQCHSESVDDAQLAGKALKRSLEAGLVEHSWAQFGDQVPQLDDLICDQVCGLVYAAA